MSEGLFSSIWGNLVSLVSALPSLIDMYNTYILPRLPFKFTFLEFLLGSILVIIAVVKLVTCIYNCLSYKSYLYPRKKIWKTFKYEITKKEVVYRRDDNDKLHYERHMTIKSRSNFLNYIYDKYTWTGTQSNNFALQPVRGLASIKPIARIGIWQYCLLELQNHLNRGKSLEISYRWPEISECTKSSPFFSTSTEYPTKKLSLSIDLGSEYKGQEILCQQFRSIDADYPLKEEKHVLDENGRFTWKIKGVKLFRYYRIHWSWLKGKPASEINMKVNSEEAIRWQLEESSSL